MVSVGFLFSHFGKTQVVEEFFVQSSHTLKHCLKPLEALLVSNVANLSLRIKNVVYFVILCNYFIYFVTLCNISSSPGSSLLCCHNRCVVQ